MSLTRAHPRLIKGSFSFENSIQALKDNKDFDGNIHVLGTLTPGDGGGGLYYWDKDSIQTPDDEAVVKATDVETGRWIRTLQQLEISFVIDENSTHDTIPTSKAVLDYLSSESGTLSLLEYSTTIAATPSTNSFQIVSDRAWSASTDVSWITIENDSGDGSAELSFSVTLNEEDNNRLGIITIVSGIRSVVYTVTQLVNSEISLIETSRTVNANSDSYGFVMNSALDWTATSSAPWLTVTPTSGSGSVGNNIIYFVQENTSEENDRVGIITISDGFTSSEYTVTQQRVITSVLLDPSTISIPAEEDSGTLADNNITVTSNSSNWNVTTDVDWIILNTLSGSQNGQISWGVTEANNTLDDKVGTITVTSNQGSESVTVTHQAKIAYLNVTGDGNINGEAQTLVINVDSNVNWSVDSISESWITIASITSGAVSLNIGENPSELVGRTASIRFVDDVGENIEVDFEISQAALVRPALNSNLSLRASIDTTSTNHRTLRLESLDNVIINWGDGSAEEIVSVYSGTASNLKDSALEHTYALDGQYDIWIKQGTGKDSCSFSLGCFTSSDFNRNSAEKITEIVQWGEMKLTTLDRFCCYCKNLTTLPDITPDFDTSEVTSMDHSFFECESLQSFPVLDTSSVTKMEHTWQDCISLVSFPTLITGSVTIFDSTWYNCSSLASFPAINTSAAITFRLVWHSCSTLTEFPYINTSNATTITSSWENCSSLTDFPTLLTGSATNISFSWLGCTSLTSFPQIDTANVVNMQGSWENCTSLISFPLIDTTNVVDMQDAWDDCSTLTSFPLINTTSVEIMMETWQGCSSLTEFPQLSTGSVTNMNRAWANCSGLTEFPFIATNNVATMNRTWNNCTGLTSFPLINTTNVVIMNRTWQNCSGLTAFPLIDTSSVTNMEGTWDDCSGLTGPTGFPLINTTNVTNMNSTWENCSGLTEFPEIDTSSVTSMKRTWYNCSSLTSFFPSGLDTSSVRDMTETWQHCSSLTSFPSIDVGSCQRFEQTWYDCNSLTTFNPFINTTYSESCWRETFAGTNNIIKEASNNPFANLGVGENIPVSNNMLLGDAPEGFYRFSYDNVFDSQVDFRPRFDLSNAAAYIDTRLGNCTLAKWGIVGIDNMTFNIDDDPINLLSFPDKEIDLYFVTHTPYVGVDIIDEIIRQVHSNRANHVEIGVRSLDMDLGTLTYSNAVQTEVDDLIADGWIITSGN